VKKRKEKVQTPNVQRRGRKRKKTIVKENVMDEIYITSLCM